MQKSIKNKFIAVAVFAILAIANFLLALSEKVSEWMTTNVYFLYAKTLGRVFNQLPFDVFEVAAFIFVAVDLFYLIYVIYDYCHKNNIRATNNLSGIILGIVIVLCLYSGTAGYAYNRAELDIDKVDNLLESSEAIKLSKEYFSDLYLISENLEIDENGNSVCQYSDEEIIEKITLEYEKLTSKYFLNYTSNPKQIASSYLMSAFGIEGITFVPTVEAGYNYEMLYFDKIFAIAHELAHTKGVMRESDANIVAAYILLTSDDMYLRYSGFINTYSYIYNVFYLANDTEAIKELQFSDIFINDIKIRKAFWEEKSILDSISNALNNIYLKINGQSGVDSYISNSDHEEDEQEDGTIIYTVKEYSFMQNMIFKLYVND